MERFLDRREAGRALGERLAQVSRAGSVVLGLPRGGVPVAVEVARALGAPLDVLVVRKLGVPGREEVAMGAVGEDGATVLNSDVIAMAAVSEREVRRVAERERAEVRERVQRFRGGRRAVPLVGRTAIVVDDGVATGATARAGCRIARARGAGRIVLAVPVGAPETLTSFEVEGDADEVVCSVAPRGFMAVGMHYVDFAQTEDTEVVGLLRGAREAAGEADS